MNIGIDIDNVITDLDAGLLAEFCERIDTSAMQASLMGKSIS